jgi:hypothetical protein
MPRLPQRLGFVTESGPASSTTSTPSFSQMVDDFDPHG